MILPPPTAFAPRSLSGDSMIVEGKVTCKISRAVDL
jgi:hypothetical protein